MTDRHRKPEHVEAFRHSINDLEIVRHVPDTPQTRSPTYRLAFADPDFLTRPELRPVRLQLELLKPEMILTEQEVCSTVVLFGGARILPPERAHRAATPKLAEMSRFYDEARRFAREVTRMSLATGGREWVITTGGGPGVMEAGSRGAADVGGRSVGLNIVLPHEQAPNLYVTPELCFNFHYFGIRKMHFLMRARAIAVFPGGFGTLDELFEALTLIQTERMQRVPFLLFGREFWDGIINWRGLVEAGTIAAEDLDLFRYVETAEEAVRIMREWDAELGREQGERGDGPLSEDG